METEWATWRDILSTLAMIFGTALLFSVAMGSVSGAAGVALIVVALWVDQ